MVGCITILNITEYPPDLTCEITTAFKKTLLSVLTTVSVQWQAMGNKTRRDYDEHTGLVGQQDKSLNTSILNSNTLSRVPCPVPSG